MAERSSSDIKWHIYGIFNCPFLFSNGHSGESCDHILSVFVCIIKYSIYNLSSATLCYIRLQKPHSSSYPDLVICFIVLCCVPETFALKSLNSLTTQYPESLAIYFRKNILWCPFAVAKMKSNAVFQRKNQCICISHISLHSCVYVCMWTHIFPYTLHA